ncbi:MAG: ABC transporter permease [Acidobacteriota bacterium]
MRIPLVYTLRHLWNRRTATAIHLLVVVGVVTMLTLVLSLARGLDHTLVDAGDPRVLVVKSKRARAEAASAIPLTALGPLASLPHLARHPDGTPVMSPECTGYVAVLPRGRQGAERTNIAVRGLEWRQVRRMIPGIRIVNGRLFEQGRRELIVGRAASRWFEGLAPRDRVMIGSGIGDRFEIVGVFAISGQDGDTGSVRESELWGDYVMIMDSYRRPFLNSVRLRVADDAGPQDVQSIMETIATGSDVDARREPEVFGEYSRHAREIRFAAAVLGVLMGAGAVFAIANTLFAAASGRLREIGVLRAIGFSSTAVLAAFLVEALLLSGTGGILGCLLAAQFNGIQKALLSQTSMTAVVYEMRVTPALLAGSFLLSLLLGALGGLAPAVRAARMHVVDAIRGIPW